MTAPVHIREASTADATSLHEVHAAAVGALEGGSYPRKTIRRWLSLLNAEDYVAQADEDLLAVAEQNGRIVGFGEINLRTGHLLSLYIHPLFAGTGVGSRLLMHLEQRTRSHGAQRVTVLSSVNAESFYARRGYRVVGMARKRVAADFAVEGVQMEKKL